MDLRMCPSCQQSVLDDDVADCPFCGAAMDGSRSAAPTKKQQPSAKKSTSGKKQTSQSEKSQQAAKEKEKNADPFAVKAKVNKTAIALRRKPTAKIMHRVVCPMCDTSGFATPAVAGKEVKCPNPKCLMPIFNAPELPKEEPVEEKKTIFTPALLGSLGGGIVIIGILAYFFVLLPEKPNSKPDIVVPSPDPDPAPGPNPKPDPDPQPAKTSLTEIKRQIFEDNKESVLQRTNNRSKPFCRQLSAETFVEVGDLDAAIYQLKKLGELNDAIPFFKITPLVKMGWHHLKKGDTQAAKKFADQAVELTKTFPKFGNDAISHTVRLGSLLIALEEHVKARELMETREKIQKANFNNIRPVLILEDFSFDLHENYNWLPELGIEAPLTFASAYGASVRGYGKQAMDWVSTLKSLPLKSSAMAGYAAGMSRKDPDFDPLKTIRITGSTNIDEQRAIALSLNIKSYQKKTEQFPAIVSEIQKNITKWKAATPVKIPNDIGIYQGEYKSAEHEAFVAVHTHKLLARFYAKTGKPELAWKQIESALRWTQAIAPSGKQTKKLLSHLKSSRTQIQNEISKKFKITQPVSQRNAFSKYRNQIHAIEADAAIRSQLETTLLQDSLKWGLALPLSNYFQQQLTAENSNSNFIEAVEKSLLNDLVFSLKTNNNIEQAASLRTKYSAQINSQSASLEILQQLQRLIDAGSVKQARELFNRKGKILKQPHLNLRFASQLALKQPPHITINWLVGIPDVIEQEFGFQMAACLASKKGLIREFWAASKQTNLSAPKKCSVHLGLIEGLSHSASDAYKKETVPGEPKK